MAKGKPGRPTVYSEDVASEIVQRISEGESLRGICEASDMPAKGTVLGWVNDDREGFADRYARACFIRAQVWAEETVEIADDSEGDVQRDRLRVDTRKWHISKLLPSYADRQQIEHSGTIDLNRLNDLSDEELAAIAAGEAPKG